MSKSKERPSAAANVTDITKALAAPFELTEVKFKPQVVKNNRAMALAYVDARAIQDRLDAVLGVEGWQDEYTTLEDGSVICRLRLRLVAVNASGCPGVALMTAAAIRIPATTARNATNSVVLNAALVSVDRRRT